MSRLTAVFDCVDRDDDGQPEQDHVAADLGRGLGQPQPQERRILEDGEGALGRDRRLPSVARRRAAPSRRQHGLVGTSRPVVGHGEVRFERGGQGRVAALDELDEAPLEGRPLEQDVTAAGPAAQPDVGAETVDEPGVAAAGMGPTEAHDVAEQQRQDGSGRHGGQGIRAGAGRRPARGRGPSPARPRGRPA